MLHAHLPSYLVNSQAIKPSVSFLNLNRQKQVFNHYVDLQEGPSGMQKRPDIATDFERTSQSIWQEERNKHSDMQGKQVSQLSDARKTMYGSDAQAPGLKSPKQMREEIKEVKNQLESYKQFKTE